MEELFTPHVGLMVWTVAAFLVLVVLLGRYAWKPILTSLEERDRSIAENIRSARESKVEAEKLRQEYDDRLSSMEARAEEILAKADVDSRRLKEEMVAAAKTENERLLESTKKKLAEEERRLLRDVRSEVADLSLRAAEKILRHGLDKTTQDRLLKETLDDMNAPGQK